MKLKTSDLKTDRQWRASTGLSEDKFKSLLRVFEEKYIEIHQEKIENKKERSPMQSAIKNCEDLLLLTLFSLKSGVTYDVLGFVTGMDGATAKRNQQEGLQVLKETLRSEGVAPVREFKSVQLFRDYFKNDGTLIVDGTEQKTERPKDKTGQKQNYSGKKKLSRLKRRSSRIPKSASGT